MEDQSQHEMDTKAYALFKKSRKEHLKIDFPNLREDDIEKRLIDEWENLSEKQKDTYYNIALDRPRLYDNDKFM